jgi:ferric-dicitrate binding protein FerR (iron transport regulator)
MLSFPNEETSMRHRSIRRRALGLLLTMCLHPAVAQVPGCSSSPATTGPARTIVRCPGGFTIEVEQGAQFHRLDQGGLPSSLELDGGAALIDHPARRPENFQILTPQAVASVRGTTFVVDAPFGRTSVLVVRGAVSVARRSGTESVLLWRGYGVDVDNGPLVRKHWAPARAAALLARFGR